MYPGNLCESLQFMSRHLPTCQKVEFRRVLATESETMRNGTRETAQKCWAVLLHDCPCSGSRSGSRWPAASALSLPCSGKICSSLSPDVEPGVRCH